MDFVRHGRSSGFATTGLRLSRKHGSNIDASWTIEADTAVSGGADDDKAWLTAAVTLNGRMIVNVRVDDDGTLRLITDCGFALVVSGEPEPYTVGEAWRLSGWRPT